MNVGQIIKFQSAKRKTKVGISQQKLEKFCGLNRNFEQKQAAYNSCFNILADLVELRAVIINPFNQSYSAIKSASILKQQNVMRQLMTTQYDNRINKTTKCF